MPEVQQQLNQHQESGTNTLSTESQRTARYRYKQTRSRNLNAIKAMSSISLLMSKFQVQKKQDDMIDVHTKPSVFLSEVQIKPLCMEYRTCRAS